MKNEFKKTGVAISFNLKNHFKKRSIKFSSSISTFYLCLAIFGVLSLAIAPVKAQNQITPINPSTSKTEQTLRIATRTDIPPFVFEKNGRLEGFSMDLWQKIAIELGAQYQLFPYSNVKELLTSVQAGKTDLGIAAISITSEREEKFDFSYPMFESGLQVMVPTRSNGGNLPSVLNIIGLIFSPSILQLIGIMALMILIPAHIVWFSERRHEENKISKDYFPGILEACWWSAATLGAQADSMPKSVMARIVAIIWMFTSVVFIAYFTATVTTSLTMQQLQGNIQGPDDLPGKTVATITGSTSIKYLKKHFIKTLEFPSMEQVYNALLKGNVDAVVFDSPVLLYYATHEGSGKVQVVGDVFEKESYGIVFKNKNPLRKEISSALLTLKERGDYDQIYKQWFTNK